MSPPPAWEPLEMEWDIGVVVYEPAVPNFLSIHGINDDTVTLDRCRKSLPLFARLNPPPTVCALSLGAGIHSWGWKDENLPQGIVPPVAKLWHDAIMNGFFTA
jgi:hypothetical protein